MRHPALVIETLARPTIAERRVELVERKGLGHPDTICDSLVEAIAVALNRMYDRLGEGVFRPERGDRRRARPALRRNGLVR